VKEIQLLIVPADLELTSALSLMRIQRSAALLVEKDAGYALYSAGRVAAGRAKQARTLAEIQPDLTPQPIAGAAAAAPPGTGRVLIHDLVLADIFVAAPRDYYCNGPRHHSFPPPDVSEGDECPSGDGFIVSAQ
jgi:hypothetical protein